MRISLKHTEIQGGRALISYTSHAFFGNVLMQIFKNLDYILDFFNYYIFMVFLMLWLENDKNSSAL